MNEGGGHPEDVRPCQASDCSPTLTSHLLLREVDSALTSDANNDNDDDDFDKVANVHPLSVVLAALILSVVALVCVGHSCGVHVHQPPMMAKPPG